MANWTFAIATDGVSWPKYHMPIIESIRAQKIPEYEILFCTENKNFKIDEPNVRTIYIGDHPKKWITKKKNEMTKAAKYPLVCYLHDYVILDSNWYEGYQKFGYDWDVCSNQILRPDGSRHRDWMSLDHPKYGHNEIPYNVIDITNKMYVSGTYWCAWRYFMLGYPLNETRCHLQDEDGEWSRRVRNFWRLKFNNNSVVRCLRFRP